MNELIAEKVMEWSRITPKGKVSQVNYFGWHSWLGGEPEYQYIMRIRNFSPSTNMDDAWKVIRKLNNCGYKVEVTQTETHSFCTVYDSGYAIAEAEATHHQTSYVICLAALQAMEVETS